MRSLSQSSSSRDNTDMAKFLDISEAEFQGKNVIVMSRDDTGGAELQGQDADRRRMYKSACLDQPPAGPRDC